MAAAIVKKAFENWDKADPGQPFYTPNLDKFLLKIFNRLSHNCKVSRPLVAGLLLDLSDYYILDTPVKSIDIFVLKDKFPLLIFR